MIARRCNSFKSRYHCWWPLDLRRKIRGSYPCRLNWWYFAIDESDGHRGFLSALPPLRSYGPGIQLRGIHLAIHFEVSFPPIIFFSIPVLPKLCHYAVCAIVGWFRAKSWRKHDLDYWITNSTDIKESFLLSGGLKLWMQMTSYRYYQMVNKDHIPI